MSVDFSGYFEKEKQPAAAASVSTEAAAETPAKRRHSAFSDVLGEEGNEAELESASNKKQVQAHDPKEDYPFDSSVGKLYRLMEDTILETVLVNRLTGRPGRIIERIAHASHSRQSVSRPGGRPPGFSAGRDCRRCR
jgi:hypothetical protein